MRVFRSTSSAPAASPHDVADTDRVFIVRAQHGDRSAFEELVRRHQGIAFRAARSFGGSDEVDDIVQDAFVKAHRKLEDCDPERPFRPWLMAFVANEASHRRRSRARRQNLQDKMVRQRVESERSAEDVMLRRRELEPLREALARLNDRDRRVIVYRHLLEFSENETAAALGCPPGTVKSRLARAMVRLRAALTEPGVSDV
jgi:RNA polymerase sigma factor (sigma-70 family)